MAGTPTSQTNYKIRFKLNPEFEIILGSQLHYDPPTPSIWTNLLNVSQLTTITAGDKLDPERAREILDTSISELLPTQSSRQDQVNVFFQDFNKLIGDAPPFSDIDFDGVNEYLTDDQSAQESGSRISHENKPDAYITRLDDNANTINASQTLQSMRNKLNTYLTDVDNIVQEIPDQRPIYINKLRGYLKIRKPNQAIILRPADGDEMEFQKEVTGPVRTSVWQDVNDDWIIVTGPSYLVNGFTITMWVKFIGKTSEGTLFNFGNPLETNGYGFRLDTKATEYPTNSGIYHRHIRLIVNDTLNPRLTDGSTIRDNHTGAIAGHGESGAYEYISRINQRSTMNPGSMGYAAFPSIGHDPTVANTTPTDNLTEWYFICATFDPSVQEMEYVGTGMGNWAQGTYSNPMADGYYFAYINDTHYWMNHKVFLSGDYTYHSGQGAKCKVEIISKSDLLRARGFKVPGEDISSNV